MQTVRAPNATSLRGTRYERRAFIAGLLALGCGDDMRLIGARSPAAWVVPTVPVSDKCAYFLIGDDIVDATTWAPRRDTLSVGNPTVTAGTKNTSGWVTPEGNRTAMDLNGTSSLMRFGSALATMPTADDPAWEVIKFYKINGTNASNTLFGWTSTSSATPKRIVAFTTAGYRVTQQSTTGVFSHNATNLLQQMLRVRSVNSGSGTDITVWRNEEIDPVTGTGVSIPGNGTLAQNVAAQAVNTFTIGAQDNGGSVVNFANETVFALWVRDPAAAPLTDDEAIEIHNFIMGGYNTAPLYSGSTPFFLPWGAGQSNSIPQGIATGAVAGLPDDTVKTYFRNLNNTAVDPTGIAALDLRGTYHGAWAYFQRGGFGREHHMAGVGKGATNAGSDWGGQNGAGPTNSLQGLYSTSLPSEVRRNIFMTRCRFGGNPLVQCTWWQGENDAAAGSVVAGQYQANFTAIKSYIRTYWARMGRPNVPVHAMKLNPAQTGGGIVLGDLNTINAGIDAAVALDPYARALSWSDLTGGTYVQGDNLHATAAAFAIIATRFKTSFQAFDPRL